MAQWTNDDTKNLIYGFFPYLYLSDKFLESGGIKGFNGEMDDSKWLAQLWNGLTGQTSANATIKANEMNIANQNYWNAIAMEREDTAHQREVADLQAAGLNPWLSVSGQGTSAGNLQAPVVQPADGSKIMQATSAMALLAITKLLLKAI